MLLSKLVGPMPSYSAVLDNRRVRMMPHLRRAPAFRVPTHCEAGRLRARVSQAEHLLSVAILTSSNHPWETWLRIISERTGVRPMRREERKRILAVCASAFVFLLLPSAGGASGSSYRAGASVVLGQPSFASGVPATSATGEHGPVAVAFDHYGNIWVAESHNNRVIEYAAPFSSGEAASLVLGQPDFTGRDFAERNSVV